MKFIVITKKHIIALIAAALVLIIGIITSVTVFAKSNKKLPIYSVDNNKKEIAISFDAAWGNGNTDTIIEILKKYNVPATFFIIGEWAEKYPQSVKKLADAGISIQNHSNSHPYFTKLTTEEMITEIRLCNEKIAQITDKTPTLIRLPYGDYNNKVINVIESVNMYTIQWTIDSKDWMDTATTQSIIDNVINKAASGSIVLFHNNGKYTPDALPTILESLISQGYTFVLIEDLILKENYEIDNKGMQYKIK